ncbi:hypothetical protein RhiTH_010483 [Rhizoctonia solani]
MPCNWQEICPCCQKALHYRTVRQHLKKTGTRQPERASQRNLDNGNPCNSNIDLSTIISQLDELDVGADKGANRGAFLDNPAPICQNPLVTIEDWPEPGDEDPNNSEIDQAIPEDSPNQGPNFVEQCKPQNLDPDFEGEFTDQELCNLMELNGTFDKGE